MGPDRLAFKQKILREKKKTLIVLIALEGSNRVTEWHLSVRISPFVQIGPPNVQNTLLCLEASSLFCFKLTSAEGNNLLSVHRPPFQT